MDNLTPEAWEQRYQNKGDRWNLGCPAPPFVSLLASSDAPQLGKIAVLGCGKGHDALFFAQSGYEVTGFDFAPMAISEATTMAKARGIAARFEQRDIFTLDKEFANSFDYVLEHTCFCAIDPNLRSRYVELVTNILHPGGKLIGLFYTHNRPGGPPFGIQPQEVLSYFSNFEPILFEKAKNSISRRQGDEHLAIFKLSRDK